MLWTFYFCSNFCSTCKTTHFSISTGPRILALFCWIQLSIHSEPHVLEDIHVLLLLLWFAHRLGLLSRDLNFMVINFRELNYYYLVQNFIYLKEGQVLRLPLILSKTYFLCSDSAIPTWGIFKSLWVMWNRTNPLRCESLQNSFSKVLKSLQNL
jgi:hypothetical protein